MLPSSSSSSSASSSSVSFASAYDNKSSFPTTMKMIMPKTTTTRIAISGYKNSRKSHVGIHLWEAPSSSTSMTNSTSKKRKQIMIVHIDDHSIFATASSSATTTTTTVSKSKSSSSTAQQHPESAPVTLKVGMKLTSVNGTTIRHHHSIQDIYKMLQNALGCVTLLVCTPTITTTIGNDHTIATDEKMSSDACIQNDYDVIPDMKPLIANDEYSSSSAASSFSSSSSSSLSQQQKWNTFIHGDSEDDEEDEDESIINNTYALENRIRSIWSPILANGSGSIRNRQRHTSMNNNRISN